MRSNIDQTKRELENRPETESVQIDGDTSEVILRAIVDDVSEDFEDAIESLPGVDIKHTKYIGFGVEVTLR